jgi:hypothetical protein
MARLRKRELVNQMQAGNPPTATELAAIDRLEVSLATRERIERVRARTRSR